MVGIGRTNRGIHESDGDGLLAFIAGHILSYKNFSFVKDFEMKSDANDAQNHVPSQNVMQMSQIFRATVNRLISRPIRNGDDDKRQRGSDRDQSNDTTIRDAGFVPFVTNDGQVTIASGQQEAEQQCGIIDGANENVKSTGNGILGQNDVHLESNLDEKETLEQRNGSPENVTRIAQLSRITDHKQNETIETHPNDDH